MGVGGQRGGAVAEELADGLGPHLVDGGVEGRLPVHVLNLKAGRAAFQEPGQDPGVAGGGGVVEDAPALAVLLAEEVVKAGAGGVHEHLDDREDGAVAAVLVLVEAGGVHERGGALVVLQEGGGPVLDEHLHAFPPVAAVGAGEGEGGLAEEHVHLDAALQQDPAAVVVDIDAGAGGHQRSKSSGP